MALVEGGGRRLVATGRAPLARDLVQRYAQGESIRACAADTGRTPPAGRPACSADGEAATDTRVALVEGGGRRLVATGRAPLARDLVQRYAQGESVRAFAADTGRSYVFVHRLLVEPGVRLRARGGGRKAET